MRTISLDLAFNNIGASIFDDDELVKVKCFKIVKQLPKRRNRDDRISRICIEPTGSNPRDDFAKAVTMSKNIWTYIKEERIEHVVFEMPAGAQHARPAKLLGMVQGMLAMALAADGLSFFSVSPHDVKKALYGRSHGISKDAVDSAINKLYPTFSFTGVKAYDEHIKDSIGAYEAYKQLRKYQAAISKSVDRMLFEQNKSN